MVKSAYKPSDPAGLSLSQLLQYETNMSIPIHLPPSPPTGWDPSPSQGYLQHQVCRNPFIQLGKERHDESKVCCPRTQHNVPGQGPISRNPRNLFVPVRPWQNLEPYDYRVVLFSYSKDEMRFHSYKKFQAYTLLRFQIQMI